MKNLDKLRPLDVEKMNAGEPICFYLDGSERKYLYGPDAANKIAVVDDKGFIQTNMNWQENYRMAPLFWLEGGPVYEGDVLYSKEYGKGVIVKDEKFAGEYGIKYDGAEISCQASYFLNGLSWNKPKVKREGWINIYHNNCVSDIHETNEIADDASDENRVACIRIEWEE